MVFPRLLKSLVTRVALVVSLLGTSAFSQEQPLTKPQGKVEIIDMKGAKGVAEQVNVIEEMIGHIDWEKKVVYAVGDGVMPRDAISPAQARVRAKRAAIDTAYGRLLEAVQEVRVDSESVTRNYVNEYHAVRVKVQGFVKNAEIEKLVQFEDGSYQVMMRMPLAGANGLVAAIHPLQVERVRKVRKAYEISREQVVGKKASPPVVVIEPAPERQKEPEREARVRRPTGPFSGLIVDARGLGAKPALYPKIMTEDGRTVYDLATADPNTTLEEGLVDYRKSLDQARKLARVGNNPLVVKATKVGGRYKADIVISDADAEKLAQAGGERALKEARVVVVVD